MIHKLEKIHEDFKNQINSFDFKAEILIAVNGVILGLFIFNDLIDKIQKNNWTFAFIIIFFILASLSLFFFVLVIIPRKNKKIAEKFRLYYLDASKMEITDFESFRDIDYIKELKNQIIINAKICRKKHFWLRFGIFLLVTSILFSFMGLAIILI